MVARAMSSVRGPIGIAAFVLAGLALAAGSVRAADNPGDFPSGFGRPIALIPNGAHRPSTIDGADSVRTSSANPLWGIPIELLHATRERPLFSASRRPPMPIVIAAPQPTIEAPKAPDEPTLDLIGTVTGNPDAGYAIFVDKASHDVVRLKTGEGRDGWILQSVSKREAILEKDQRSAIVRLPPMPGDNR
jgi:general secretion pathway protein N